MIKCPFCLKEKKSLHPKSHIIPEWMYNDIYDHKHKATKISTSDNRLEKKQSGIYNRYIICSSCEEMFGKDDHYASLILTERSPQNPELLKLKKITIKNKIDFSIWSDFNFRKLQKFILGVILRQELAEQSNKKTLLKKHFNLMRNIYFDGSGLDDSSYPIILIELPLDDKYRKLIHMPYAAKKNGHHIVQFAGAGFHFHVYVSSHEKPEEINYVRMKSNNTAIIFRTATIKTGIFKSLVPTLRKIATSKRSSTL